VVIKSSQDARKEPIKPAGLKELFRGQTRLLVAKGKKLVDLKLGDIDKAELERLVIGPSGNLRAPTFLRGKKAMVGYHEEGYAAFLA
jgi:arsenate reductase-like glutaredoxin family protein